MTTSRPIFKDQHHVRCDQQRKHNIRLRETTRQQLLIWKKNVLRDQAEVKKRKSVLLWRKN